MKVKKMIKHIRKSLLCLENRYLDLSQQTSALSRELTQLTSKKSPVKKKKSILVTGD
jgi:archaellum component FlaC